MIAILVSYSVIITAIYGFTTYLNYKEKKRLTELLAAKDYADYKKFEEKTTEKKYTNIYQARDKRLRSREQSMQE